MRGNREERHMEEEGRVQNQGECSGMEVVLHHLPGGLHLMGLYNLFCEY